MFEEPRWNEEPLELVMPFVVLESVGGPYEDTAFSAGYQLGVIDNTLENEINLLESIVLVYSDSLPQLDLIAMRHNFRIELLQKDEQWAQVLIKKVFY